MDRSFLLRQPTDDRVQPDEALKSHDVPSIQACLRPWRELDGKFRFVLDIRGTVLAGEDVFFHPNVAGADFHQVNARIRPANSEFVSHFDRLLRCSGPETMLIPKSCEPGHWICRAVPVAAISMDPEAATSRRMLAVSINGTGTGARAQWADLQTAFTLTQTEERTLRLMMSGKSVAEIAKREAVSINTLRTHVRHIHEKLVVSDANEMWVQVMDYRLL